MSLRSASARLSRAKKDLDLAWQRARTEWRDEPSRAFERQYLAPVEDAVRRALESMAAMDRLNAQAHRDCE